MKYITRVQALNIEDSTECCGDWHQSSMNWSKLDLAESDDSMFGDWGIEVDKTVPEHNEHYNVANTLRAILDLLQNRDNLGYLKGFKDDFLCTDKYNQEFFEKVYELNDKVGHWKDIDRLMQLEFMWDWDNFIASKEHKN